MIEYHLRWFGYVQRKSVEVPVKRVDQIKGNTATKGRSRSRKIIGEIVKKDLYINGLNTNMIYDKVLYSVLFDLCSRPT